MYVRQTTLLAVPLLIKYLEKAFFSGSTDCVGMYVFLCMD